MKNQQTLLTAIFSIMYYLLAFKLFSLVHEIIFSLFKMRPDLQTLWIILLIPISIVFTYLAFRVFIGQIQRINLKSTLIITFLALINPLYEFGLVSILSKIKTADFDRVQYLEFYGQMKAVSYIMFLLFFGLLFWAVYRNSGNEKLD